jgi:hypothetical protein
LIEQPGKPACVPHMKPHLKKSIVADIEDLELVCQVATGSGPRHPMVLNGVAELRYLRNAALILDP